MPTGVLRGEHLLLILLYLPGRPARFLLADQEEVSGLEQVWIDDSVVGAYRLGDATIKGDLRSSYTYTLMIGILAQRVPPDARSRLGGHGLQKCQSSLARRMPAPENRYRRSNSCAQRLHRPQPRCN